MELSAEYREVSRRIARVGMLASLLILVALFFMIVKALTLRRMRAAVAPSPNGASSSGSVACDRPSESRRPRLS